MIITIAASALAIQLSSMPGAGVVHHIIRVGFDRTEVTSGLAGERTFSG